VFGCDPIWFPTSARGEHRQGVPMFLIGLVSDMAEQRG